MAKTVAPLLSFGASGQIGSSQVYGNWRGIGYARRYVIPANPQTQEQTKTRSIFATLSYMYRDMPTNGRAPWDANAQGRSYTGRNRFMGDNTRNLRGATDFTNFVASPGVLSGPSALTTTATATTADGNITVTVTTPTPPPNWELAAVSAIAFPAATPPTDYTGPIIGEEAAAPATAVTINGLPTDTPVVVSAWLVWLRPDNRLAYSLSSTQIVSWT